MWKLRAVTVDITELYKKGKKGKNTKKHEKFKKI